MSSKSIIDVVTEINADTLSGANNINNAANAISDEKKTIFDVSSAAQGTCGTLIDELTTGTKMDVC